MIGTKRVSVLFLNLVQASIQLTSMIILAAKTFRMTQKYHPKSHNFHQDDKHLSSYHPDC